MMYMLLGGDSLAMNRRTRLEASHLWRELLYQRGQPQMENSSTMLVDVNGIREKVLAETTARGLVDDLPSFAAGCRSQKRGVGSEKSPDIKTMDSTKEITLSALILHP